MLPLTVGTYFGAVEVLGWPWCDGSLKAAAAAITVFVSVQWPQLGRERTGSIWTRGAHFGRALSEYLALMAAYINAALASCGLILSGELVLLQAPIFDCRSFDPR